MEGRKLNLEITSFSLRLHSLVKNLEIVQLNFSTTQKIKDTTQVLHSSLSKAFLFTCNYNYP